MVFVRHKQQRVLVAINRGSLRGGYEDSPLLNVAGWTLQEGAGAFGDGVLTLPAISRLVRPLMVELAQGRRGGAPPATSAEPAHHSRCAEPYR